METYKSIFPPKAKLTEKTLGDQTGKVFIVTGSSAGIGAKLATILYSKNAKIYIAARSESKALRTIDGIKAEHPKSNGQLIFLHLDLNDLTTIKKSADEFLAKEARLDVLWNNAGVMVPPQGSKTAQGYELQLGTNCLAPFLFTHFLRPVLVETAKTAPPNTVRVVWVSSSAAEFAPKPPIDFSNMDYHIDEGIWNKYMRSKAGNVLHAAEFARRVKNEGVISLSLNPGNLKTDLTKTTPWWQKAALSLILHEPIKGAYTELFAGLDTSITGNNNGGWIAPFGRIESGPKELMDPSLGAEYWKWTEGQLNPYL